MSFKNKPKPKAKRYTSKKEYTVVRTDSCFKNKKEISKSKLKKFRESNTHPQTKNIVEKPFNQRSNNNAVTKLNWLFSAWKRVRHLLKFKFACRLNRPKRSIARRPATSNQSKAYSKDLARNSKDHEICKKKITPNCSKTQVFETELCNW